MGGALRVSTKSSAANLAMTIGGLQESCLLGATATAHAAATRSTTGTAVTFAANDTNIFTMATVIFADARVWAVD